MHYKGDLNLDSANDTTVCYWDFPKHPKRNILGINNDFRTTIIAYHTESEMFMEAISSQLTYWTPIHQTTQ